MDSRRPRRPSPLAEVEHLQEPAGDPVDNVLARMAELTAHRNSCPSGAS